jgi:hypothetical protein
MISRLSPLNRLGIALALYMVVAAAAMLTWRAPYSLAV